MIFKVIRFKRMQMRCCRDSGRWHIIKHILNIFATRLFGTFWAWNDVASTRFCPEDCSVVVRSKRAESRHKGDRSIISSMIGPIVGSHLTGQIELVTSSCCVVTATLSCRGGERQFVAVERPSLFLLTFSSILAWIICGGIFGSLLFWHWPAL